jgi:hypothetical protein
MRARTALLALLAALSLSAQQAEVQEGKVAALAREGHSRQEEEGPAPREARVAGSAADRGDEVHVLGDREPQQGPRPAKFRFGGRVSLTIPQDTQIYNNIGNATGYGLLGEWRLAKKMAVSCTVEYLSFAGAERDAIAFKVGADLVFRSEGLERGFFAFVGEGVVSAAQIVPTWRGKVTDYGSGAFFALGAGYDFGVFGIEARYVISSLEFKDLGETDVFDSIQCAARIRF